MTIVCDYTQTVGKLSSKIVHIHTLNDIEVCRVICANYEKQLKTRRIQDVSTCNGLLVLDDFYINYDSYTTPTTTEESSRKVRSRKRRVKYEREKYDRETFEMYKEQVKREYETLADTKKSLNDQLDIYDRNLSKQIKLLIHTAKESLHETVGVGCYIYLSHHIFAEYIGWKEAVIALHDERVAYMTKIGIDIIYKEVNSKKKEVIDVGWTLITSDITRLCPKSREIIKAIEENGLDGVVTKKKMTDYNNKLNIFKLLETLQ